MGQLFHFLIVNFVLFVAKKSKLKKSVKRSKMPKIMEF